MKRLTLRSHIQAVAGRWENQYENRLLEPLTEGALPQDTLNKLRALDLDTCSAEDVTDIVSPGWIAHVCVECEKHAPSGIMFAEDRELEGFICDACLDAASRLRKETR